MKGIIVLLLLLPISIFGQGKAKLVFVTKNIDLGEIDVPKQISKNDSVVKINFVFSNKGTAPLVIYKVVSSCGCIIPKWPAKPIKSDEKSIICIELNVKKRRGFFAKDIFVESNSVENVTLLKIKGNIK